MEALGGNGKRGGWQGGNAARDKWKAGEGKQREEGGGHAWMGKGRYPRHDQSTSRVHM